MNVTQVTMIHEKMDKLRDYQNNLEKLGQNLSSMVNEVETLCNQMDNNSDDLEASRVRYSKSVGVALTEDEWFAFNDWLINLRRENGWGLLQSMAIRLAIKYAIDNLSCSDFKGYYDILQEDNKKRAKIKIKKIQITREKKRKLK